MVISILDIALATVAGRADALTQPLDSTPTPMTLIMGPMWCVLKGSRIQARQVVSSSYVVGCLQLLPQLHIVWKLRYSLG